MTYQISAGPYEGSLLNAGISLTGRDSPEEAVSACRAVCSLGERPVTVRVVDDFYEYVYVYRRQEDANADSDGSRAVLVVSRGIL